MSGAHRGGAAGPLAERVGKPSENGLDVEPRHAVLILAVGVRIVNGGIARQLVRSNGHGP
jgi:hypothetical protein